MRENTDMSAQPFRLENLMDILEHKAGLPAADRVTDERLTLAAIGLDSLAFLTLQSVLEARYGFELPDEAMRHRPFADIIAAVNERLEAANPL
ncbi:acyl carrier protein [Kutzneria kofuensis]|uniref:Acyl carrier protein n=1 Tax=Kutzneria kofuensis TaxID=103725 RepID=A0A7W9KQN0_9PSEU|nr:acyl carrier protein [Kutzneria kofuensis]MBB5896209.1 acyl carrier protein [Kutzneria kofuensis]